MKQLSSETPAEDEAPVVKMDFLGKAYAFGSKAFEGKPETKEEIIGINKKIYERTDDAINALYDLGLAWSLAYFETVYARLGTKFNDYFPESSIGDDGLAVVRAHKDIFKESDGAIIFSGEEYGLHTRVFVNSQGLPTYEAKELGLNKKKFALYPLDLSIVVTGNEINEYFKVLMKAMELTIPDVAAKTRHVSHGMLRLPSGKMSSRTGDVITADALLKNIKAKLLEHVSEKSDLDAAGREVVTEVIAIGAIKYSILKQAPGQDIIFDFEKSLSVHGDSGPYLQYTYARLRSILRKSQEPRAMSHEVIKALDSESELALMRRLFEFPEIIASAGQRLAPNLLATYLHQLAMTANHFYESTPILKDENAERRDARLALIETTARVLMSGLGLLGIQAPEKI
jgi:arginyl-tRNA synthetase